CSTLPPPPTSPLFPYTTLFRSAGRLRQGHRGEQSDDPQLARYIAALVVELDSHVIHVSAAVDAGPPAGLGDEQRLGRAQELGMLGRHLHIFGAGAQDLDGPVTQDAEAAFLDWRQPGRTVVADEFVFSHAEEGEV